MNTLCDSFQVKRAVNLGRSALLLVQCNGQSNCVKKVDSGILAHPSTSLFWQFFLERLRKPIRHFQCDFILCSFLCTEQGLSDSFTFEPSYGYMVSKADG